MRPIAILAALIFGTAPAHAQAPAAGYSVSCEQFQPLAKLARDLKVAPTAVQGMAVIRTCSGASYNLFDVISALTREMRATRAAIEADKKARAQRAAP